MSLGPRRRLIIAFVTTVAATVSVSCGLLAGNALFGAPANTGIPADPGVAANAGGFTLVPDRTVLGGDQPVSLRFRILGAGGRPVTLFLPVQTRPMHLYLIRTDLTGFQHALPTMDPDGTWTADLTALDPGSYRAEAQFNPTGTDNPAPLVLGVTVTVPGPASLMPLPPAGQTASVDGYTVTAGGHLMSDMQHLLSVTITRDGQPVTDLEPFLGGYAHLTAFQAKYLAFADLRPEDPVNSDHGAPPLTFQATMPEPGNWRFFLEFKTNGTLHTAAITRTVS